jgi:hypothetical protein
MEDLTAAPRRRDGGRLRRDAAPLAGLAILLR